MKFLVVALALLCGVAAAAEPVKLNWSGDLRVRAMHEKDGDSPGHWAGKYRLRLGAGIKIDEELTAELRLATGKSSRDQDQVMGEHAAPGAPRRFFGLDLAYAEWTPVAFAHLDAGRIRQVHYRPGGSQIILDEDVALEGAAIKLEHTAWGVGFFANAGSATIRQNYDTYYGTAETDNMLNWAQAYVQWKADAFAITGGAGFFNFTGVKDMSFADLSLGGQAYGNTKAAAGVIKYPFLPRQYFLEASLPLGNVQLKAFGERVINNEVHERNSAWWAGVGAEVSEWNVKVAYVELERDSVLGIFTDSEFAAGRVDSHGYIGSIGWKFVRGMQVQLTEYLAETQQSTIGKEYHRTNIDLSAEF